MSNVVTARKNQLHSSGVRDLTAPPRSHIPTCRCAAGERSSQHAHGIGLRLFRAGGKLGVLRQEEEGRIRREKPVITKKAPKIGASEWNSLALFRAAPQLLLFLRSSLLFGGGLFCCALHRLILPNIKFCDQKSQCDSYIRLFARKVKKKMRTVSHSDLFRVASPRIRARVFARPSHLDRARHSYIQLDRRFS